ncbi:MAG: DUF6925 family protein [Betaproteobacteria bacterium]
MRPCSKPRLRERRTRGLESADQGLPGSAGGAPQASLGDTLAAQLARAGTSWSIGAFGALAEFERSPEEPAERTPFSVATARGAIRLEPLAGCECVPYRARSARDERDYGVALCLPEPQARLERRGVLTELGADHAAIRAPDRTALLFDLGLDTPYGTFCVRTGDEALIARLRAGAGSPLLDRGNGLFELLAQASPHRVFMSRLGRIEVYQRIAPRGGRTPEGPHTHLLPRLVKAKRTHSANALLPQGLVPCATFYAR